MREHWPPRPIPIPREVSRPAGCSCSGTTFHLLDCTINILPVEERVAAVRAAEDRCYRFSTDLTDPANATWFEGRLDARYANLPHPVADQVAVQTVTAYVQVPHELLVDSGSHVCDDTCPAPYVPPPLSHRTRVRYALRRGRQRLARIGGLRLVHRDRVDLDRDY